MLYVAGTTGVLGKRTVRPRLTFLFHSIYSVISLINTNKQTAPIRIFTLALIGGGKYHEHTEYVRSACHSALIIVCCVFSRTSEQEVFLFKSEAFSIFFLTIYHVTHVMVRIWWLFASDWIISATNKWMNEDLLDIPGGWSLITFVIPWHFLWCHQEVIVGLWWNLLTVLGLIAKMLIIYSYIILKCAVCPIPPSCQCQNTLLMCGYEI